METCHSKYPFKISARFKADWLSLMWLYCSQFCDKESLWTVPVSSIVFQKMFGSFSVTILYNVITMHWTAPPLPPPHTHTDDIPPTNHDIPQCADNIPNALNHPSTLMISLNLLRDPHFTTHTLFRVITLVQMCQIRWFYLELNDFLEHSNEFPWTFWRLARFLSDFSDEASRVNSADVVGGGVSEALVIGTNRGCETGIVTFEGISRFMFLHLLWFHLKSQQLLLPG